MVRLLLLSLPLVASLRAAAPVVQLQAASRAPVLLASAEVIAEPAPLGAVDWGDVVKYKAATLFEFGLLAGIFRTVDAVGTLPSFCVPPIFAFLALRSRVFSALPASRPDRAAQEGKATPRDVKRPSWTPPGIAFPIIWTTIAVLRATSALLSWRACGRTLFCAPLLALALHLSIGDTWNCITNVERRLGTSALGVLSVWGSVVAAVVVAYRATPIAGFVLAPSAVWISIATVLTWTIWSINEPRQPLLPRKGDGKSAKLEMPLLADGKWQAAGPPKKK